MTTWKLFKPKGKDIQNSKVKDIFNVDHGNEEILVLFFDKRGKYNLWYWDIALAKISKVQTAIAAITIVVAAVLLVGAAKITTSVYLGDSIFLSVNLYCVYCVYSFYKKLKNEETTKGPIYNLAHSDSEDELLLSNEMV